MNDALNGIKAKANKILMRRAKLLDKLTFTRILLMWVVMIVVFGTVYYFFGGEDNYLFYQVTNSPVYGFGNSFFFSFMAASLAGFGGIAPMGYFKGVALSEALCGLLVLALLTSKMVSVKQDVILDEIYELSFNEKISHLRSSLLLFRQNLGRILSRVEDSRIRKQEIVDIHLYLSNFEDTLNEIIDFAYRPENRVFSKALDRVDAELILNSVLSSFEKISELISGLNNANLEWKSDATVALLEKCISTNERLFSGLKRINALPDSAVNALEEQKNKLISRING